MSDNKRMRIPHISFTGLIIVLIGIAFLLNNLGLLPPDFMHHLWRLWPLFVIAAGLQVMFGRSGTRIGTILLVIFVILALGYLFFAPIHMGQPSIMRTELSAPKQDLTQAQVDIDFAAGTLEIASLPAVSPDFYHLVAFGPPPRVDFTGMRPPHDGTGRLRINHAETRRSMTFGGFSRYSWALQLSPLLPTSLHINAAASRGELDLRPLDVYELDLTLNASHCQLYLPSRQGRSTIEIDANASNVNIFIPHGAAARVTVSSQASSVRVEGEWEQRGEVYTSPHYTSSERQIEIMVTANASRVRISTR